MLRALWLACLALTLVASPAAAEKDITERVRERYVDSDGVRIHYVTLGRGPLVVMIHGFPDFWYGWREQMTALAKSYQVAALDLRGYNRSDKPVGIEQYDLALLVNDVAAVIRDLGKPSATIMGHDWGGGIAWQFAITNPAMTDALVILETPHPRAFLRELRTNPAQVTASTYARVFQDNTAAQLGLTPQALAGWVTDPAARARYIEAFSRSDLEAMLSFYKRNFPRAPYDDVVLPNVQAPVLIVHGENDPFTLAAGHNGTWEWVDNRLTIEIVPGVGHFIQQDAPATLNAILKRWLDAQRAD